MRTPRPNFPAVRQELIKMTGGVNQFTTQLAQSSGELVDCLNYMEVASPSEGYVSLEGYEAFDGALRQADGTINPAGPYTLPSDVPIRAIHDSGVNASTVFLLESDGTLTFEDQINGITFTNVNITEPSGWSFFQHGSSAFYNNGTGSLLYIDTTNIINFGIDDFSMELFYKSGAAVDTTVDSVLLAKEDIFMLYWDTDGTDAYLDFVCEDSTAAVFDVKTLVKLHADKIYHIVVASVGGVIRILVNGELAYDSTTLQIAEIAPTGGLAASIRTLSVGAWIDGSLPVIGHFDEVRIEIGEAMYFTTYEVPTLRYSANGYRQINFDDRTREIVRSAISPVPGASDGPNGCHYFTGDDNVYVLNDQHTDSTVTGKAKLWRTSTAGWILVDNTFNDGGYFKAVEWRIDGYKANAQLMIMVDGASYPRIWDGSTMTIINDAAVVEEYTNFGLYPNNVTVWANRLVLGYSNGRILMSASDDPEDISGGYGALLNWGDAITGFAEGPDDTLIVFMRNSIKVCYSSVEGSADFTFQAKTFSRSAGALPNTVQRALADIVYMDDRGLMTFQATDKFGDFSAASLSRNVNDFFDDRRGLVSTSRVGKNTNQYRLYFSDGYFIIWSFDPEGAIKGATFCKYPEPVHSVTVSEDSNGNIMKFFTSNNSPYLFKMDSGTSFNGKEIERYFKTCYYSYKTPRMWKRFRKFIPEIKSDNYELKFLVDFKYDYSDSTLEENENNKLEPRFNTSVWGLGTWGTFIWRAAEVAKRIYYTLSGYGTNMSIRMYHKSKFTTQHIIYNALVDFTLNNNRRR